MNKKIIFIADFFADQLLGGGELNNEELIKLLRSGDYEVEKQNSHEVNLEYLMLNKDSFFIVSNFVNLDYSCREWLCYNANYIIYEHDHKYLASRNPAIYENFKAPIREIRNYFFYKNAIKIICQSNFHKEIVEKNLQLPNIVSVGGNLWPLEILKKLKELSKIEKHRACSIMQSSIPHKNTRKSIKFCKSKDLDYELISDKDYVRFLERLGGNQKLVFFPSTPETLSRIACEARMMGMSVVTNQLVGATQEDWFKLKGEPLVDYMIGKRDEIYKLIVDEVLCAKKRTNVPKVSIITTFYKGEGFLEEFLEDITQQSVFSDCELILVDSGSPGEEQKIVEKYTKEHSNIKYHRYDHRFKGTMGTNISIMSSSAPYATWAMLDDRKRKDAISVLYSAIEESQGVDLVYGSCLTTPNKNERFDETTSEKFSEHSEFEFSRENMIKCLPGPMPLWSKRLHERCGFFDQDENDFCDDWEFWLRSIDSGAKFKKVDETVGLYFVGGRTQQGSLDQRKEEAKIFFKYAHIFGYNYREYEPYFRQFLNI